MTAMRLKRYPSPSGGFAFGKIGVGATLLKQGKTARDYVQNGLVAMWDGIENAGAGTHDAGATVWKDIVGGREFALTGVTVDADRMTFGRKCLMNVASAAKFSSDRTIRQYAEEIWHIKPTQY